MAALQPKTIANYNSLFKALTAHNETPIDRASTKSAYWTHMAAWRFCHTRAALELWPQAEATFRSFRDYPTKQGPQFAHLLELLNAAESHFDALSKAESPPDKSSFASKAKRSAKSVKHRNARLKEGWRDAVLQYAIDGGSKYATAIAVLSLTGCRPAELEMGVTCTIDGQGIAFRILGAKTHSGKYGQEWRAFTCPQDCLATHHLRNVATTRELTVTVKAHNLVDTVAKIGHRVYPRRNAVRPTAYSFRHALAADLKALKRTKEEIAGVLGHYVTDTQRYYALASLNGSARGIVSIETAREIIDRPLSPFIAEKMAARQAEGDSN